MGEADKQASEAVRQSYLSIAEEAMKVHGRNKRTFGQHYYGSRLSNIARGGTAVLDPPASATLGAKGKAGAVRESYLGLAERAAALRKRNARFSG
jgi:hypothetical protein